MVGHRKKGDFDVTGLWLVPKVRLSKGLLAALEVELERLRRFTGMERLRFADGWIRQE
jgi:uncharacterized protein YcaQ